MYATLGRTFVKAWPLASATARDGRKSTLARRKRVAVGASLFTLVASSFVTAIPAFAASTCTVDGAVLTVTVGTDDQLVLAVGDGGTAPTGIPTDAGFYSFSQNGGPFVSCGTGSDTASIALVRVVGSNAGSESLTLFHPDGGGPGESMAAENTIVDLGAGQDSLRVNYGADSTIAGGPYDGSSSFATPRLLTGNDGSLVGDLDGDGVGDLRIDAANPILSRGAGPLGDPVPGLDVSLEQRPGGLVRPGENGAQFWLSGSEFSGRSLLEGTDDDVAAANTGGIAVSGCVDECGVPFGRPVTVNAGGGDDVFHSGAGDDVFDGGQGTNTLDDSAASAPVEVGIKEEGTLHIASGTAQGGLGSDTLSGVQNVIGSSFADTITSACYPDCLSGHGGDGLIDGGPGDDVIRVDNPSTGEHTDGLIKGGPGIDVLLVVNNLSDRRCCRTQLVFEGGPGDDVIRVVNDSSGRFYPKFVLDGGGGDDVLEVENHNSSRSNKCGGCPELIGGTGDDVLVGSPQGEHLFGGTGDDTCKGGGGKDTYLRCEY